MPKKPRVAVLVYVDLDNIPGAMHTPDSAVDIIGGILKRTIPHYNPTALLIPEEFGTVKPKITSHWWRGNGSDGPCVYTARDSTVCNQPRANHPL